MRVLKIFLMLISIMVIAVTVLLTWDELSLYGTIMSLYGVLYLAIGFFSGVLNLIYQFKSFRFYRKKEKQKLHKELPEILWIGALCFAAVLFYIVQFNYMQLQKALV
jgi:hypothetical protein